MSTTLEWAATHRLSVSGARALLLLRPGPMRIGHLGSSLGMSPGSTAATCRRLEALGLVQRSYNPRTRKGPRVPTLDARTRTVWLTAAGRDILELL